MPEFLSPITGDGPDKACPSINRGFVYSRRFINCRWSIGKSSRCC